MNRPFIFSLPAFVAAVFFLAVAPALRAQGVNEKISALEAELARLKTEQMELKKEATAQADKMPTYSYRAGRGLQIDAGDKSWGFRASWVYRPDMTYWPRGNAHDERNDFTPTAKNHRAWFYYFLNDGFYEGSFGLDMDTGDLTEQQGADLIVHFDQWHPWLPAFVIGVESGSTVNWQDSSYGSFGSAQFDRTLLVQGNWINTGTYRGFGLIWEDAPAGPGEISLETILASSMRGGTDNSYFASDRKIANLFFGWKPASRTKSKWLQGLEFSMGATFHSIDQGTREDGNDTCSFLCRQRLTGNESFGAVTFMDVPDIGNGFVRYFTPGFAWQVGPYKFRATYADVRFTGRDDDYHGVKGRVFRFAHELFIRSPKGWFTGSSSTPGSILVGFSWERNDLSCGEGGTDSQNCDDSGEFQRNRVLVREVGLKYFIIRNMYVGYHWAWYDAKNLPTDQQDVLGNNDHPGQGKGGDFHTHIFEMAYRW